MDHGLELHPFTSRHWGRWAISAILPAIPFLVTVFGRPSKRMLYLRLALVDTRYAIPWGVLKDSLLGLISD